MTIETINVGDRFMFKIASGFYWEILTSSCDAYGSVKITQQKFYRINGGKRFTVVSLDFNVELVHFKFDDDDKIYNIAFDVFKMVVTEVGKWHGSKLVFNFV